MTLLIEETRNAPKIVPAGEGIRVDNGPEKFSILLSSKETGGAFMMAEVRIDEPGFGPPYHVHTLEDEVFHVKGGELHVTVDGETHIVAAGGTAYAPRNVPHTFRSGPTGAHFIVMSTGSNFEQFFGRYSTALAEGQMERIPGIAAEHGLSFVPPPAHL